MTTLQNVTQIVDVTHLVRPPSELEQARAYLRGCQDFLADARKFNWERESAARDVLAALSWVWDAQQRDPTWQVWESAQLLAAVMREAIPEPQTLFMSPEAAETLGLSKPISLDDTVTLVATPPPPPDGAAWWSVDFNALLGKPFKVGRKEVTERGELYAVSGQGVEFWALREMLAPATVGDLIYDYSVKVIDGVTGDARIVTGAEARRLLDRRPGSPRRPTRRAAAPASRGRRR
jgi:hypothetical protein